MVTESGTRELSPLGVAALALAADGYRVVPLRDRDKIPRIRGWTKAATRNPAVITRWWTDWPNANLGVRTGGGLIGIDIDGLVGEAAWVDLLDEHDLDLLETYVVTTGRIDGGRHLWLTIPRSVTIRNRTLAPGLEVRGEGGLILAPASIHPSGAVYQSANYLDPMPAPKWLIAHLSAPTASRLVIGTPDSRPLVIEPGERNDVLFRESCAWRTLGWEFAEIRQWLDTQNASRCHPPLDASELDTIARSATSYAVGHRNEPGQRGLHSRISDPLPGPTAYPDTEGVLRELPEFPRTLSGRKTVVFRSWARRWILHVAMGNRRPLSYSCGMAASALRVAGFSGDRRNAWRTLCELEQDRLIERVGQLGRIKLKDGRIVAGRSLWVPGVGSVVEQRLALPEQTGLVESRLGAVRDPANVR